RELGFPSGDEGDESTDAMSVQNDAHVPGYRRVHSAGSGHANTEEMREALMDARGLFEALLADGGSQREHGNGHLVKGHGA
ncbi:hypothetical protein ACFV00_35300, partial [Streptomyces californicus]